jgi:hypothetical protein
MKTTSKQLAGIRKTTAQLNAQLKAAGMSDTLAETNRLGSQTRERAATNGRTERERDERRARMGLLTARPTVGRETDAEGATTALSFSAVAVDRGTR